jgi:poly-gamma-glutamate synthesis protein (capsule biosynthesis protein)
MTQLWKYPIAASGDLETMTLMDKVYWLYKTIFPMKRARRGSGLEPFFEFQKTHVWSLPAGFQGRDELTLSAVGDLMPHSYLLNSSTSLYSDVSDLLFGADVSMANLEAVLYNKAAGEFSFSPRSGPPLYYNFETFDVVKGSNGKKYSFMATACNHSLDFGREGVGSTIQKLKDEHIQFNGVNELESDAFLATIVEKKGFKLGLISHTFGLNAYKPPQDRPFIVNRTPLNNGIKNINFSQFEKQIAHCKQQKVDFIIAQLHWGLEHEFFPIPDQVELAHRLAEMGIDAVIGHHPHVIQPIEYYRTKRDPYRIVPIYYSLGNLINPCSAPYLSLSQVAQIVVVRGTSKDNSVQTYVKNAAVTQVNQVVDNDKKQISLVALKGSSGEVPRPKGPGEGRVNALSRLRSRISLN